MNRPSLNTMLLSVGLGFCHLASVAQTVTPVTDFRSGFDFSLKPGDGLFVFCHRSWKELDGDDAFHAAMLGLEHLPHASRTNLLHQDIVTQRERFSFSSINHFRLILRQLLFAD